MFFKLSVLKRLFKAAYKGNGLVIGHVEDGGVNGLYVTGSWWSIFFDDWHIPKEVRGELISLTGELPEGNYAFRTENEEYSQSCMVDPAMNDIWETTRGCRYSYKITRFMENYNGMVLRYLQEPKTESLVKVNDMVLSLIDPDAIEKDDGEMLPNGPVTTEINADYVYWFNDRCILKVQRGALDSDMRDVKQAYNALEPDKREG